MALDQKSSDGEEELLKDDLKTEVKEEERVSQCLIGEKEEVDSQDSWNASGRA